jgi:phospholipid/cholesterol/gamma-HCH transport system substrate-binding protein
MRRVLTVVLLLVVVPAAILFGSGAGGNNGGDYKVRAIFDNASFLIKGQDVKVAGAKVGSVESLDVTPDHKAAIVLDIQRNGFKDFRQDAHCEVRLQSVIGEKLVACEPTQPRAPGAPESPPLQKIPDGQPGAGQYLLPVQNTTTPVDADLINDIQRRPFRERLSVLLSELGTGLAARAGDLRELILRANPALREFDTFLHILANQNKMLKELTGNADKVLTALGKKRRSVARFFTQSRIAAQATAEKRRDLERNFQKFPPFLRQLRPFMERFAGLSSAMAPVISDLRASGPDLSRLLIALGPFSLNSGTAIKSLGNTADVGRPVLVGAKPVAEKLAAFTSKARGFARNFRLLTTSIQQHKGIERLMDVLFYNTLSTNGFDEIGHYLRNNLIVTICSGYAITPTVGCSANFQSASSSAASSSASIASISRQLIKLIGDDRKRKHAGKAGAARTGGAQTQPVSDPSSGDAAPKATSPSAPAPQRSPSIQAAPGGSDDGLLDYLLGGAQ